MDTDAPDPSTNGTSFRRDLDALMNGRPVPEGSTAFPPGTIIGRYEVVEWIGTGTFGIVLRVRDPRLGRERAMKLPNARILLSKKALDEFRDEARKAAMVDHPNVVRVYDADEAGPVSYLVMEYCPDRTLLDWIKRRDPDHPVPFDWAAKVVAEIALGLQQIHAAGLIHRDLKPGNVMLVRVGADGDDLPNFRPKVTDFGLAESLDEEATASAGSANREARGTYAYMSPEQARGSRNLREPSDVHALGIILYELLTGRRPFQGESTIELAGRIVKDEPISPRLLRAGLPRDLETITLKCLEKDPARRYATAREVADDLRRHLARRPILARPAPAWERLWKWGRRRPLMAASIAIVALLATALVVGLAWLNARERRHNRELTTALGRAERGEFWANRHLLANSLRRSQEALEAGQIEQAQEMLHDVTLDSRGNPRRDFAFGYLWGRSRREVELHWGNGAPIAAAFYTLGDRAVVSVDRSGNAILRDATTFAPVAELTGNVHPRPQSYAVSPDGLRLAVAFKTADERAFEVLYWDLDVGGGPMPSPAPAPALAPGPGPIRLSKIRPAGHFAAPAEEHLHDIGFVGGRETLGVLQSSRAGGAYFLDTYDLSGANPPRLARRRETSRLASFDPTARTVAIPSRAGMLDLVDPVADRVLWESGVSLDWPPAEYSQDGRLILTRSGREAVVRDVATGKELGRCAIDRPLYDWGLSPDGQKVVFDLGKSELSLINLEIGSEVILKPSDRDLVHHDYPSFSPDGRFLITRSRPLDGRRGRLILWDAATGRQVRVCPANLEEFLGFRLTPDGRTVLIFAGRALKVWRLDPSDEVAPLAHPPEAWAAAYSPSGMFLATGGDDNAIRFWDATTLAPLGVLKGKGATVVGLAYSPDGGTMASASLGSEHNLTLWDLATNKARRQLGGHSDRVRCVAFSPDGTMLASGSWDHTVRLWDARTGRHLRTLDLHSDRIRSVAFSPDGLTIATGGEDDCVRLWDPRTGRALRVFPSGNEATAVAFNPHGAMLAWGNRDGRLVIHDLARGESAPPINTRAGEVLSLAFSPDGFTIATGGTDGVVRLWDATTGEELLTLTVGGPKRNIRGLSFAPDGSSLAASSENGSVQVWRAAP